MQSIWQQSLANLAVACAAAFAEDESDLIRDAHDLFARAPDPVLIAGLEVPGSGQLERLIASGAGVSVVLAMLGGDAGYLLSRGSGGEHLASIILPGAERDVSAYGDTLALALIGAMARALSEGHPVKAQLN